MVVVFDAKCPGGREGPCSVLDCRRAGGIPSLLQTISGPHLIIVALVAPFFLRFWACCRRDRAWSIVLGSARGVFVFPLMRAYEWPPPARLPVHALVVRSAPRGIVCLDGVIQSSLCSTQTLIQGETLVLVSSRMARIFSTWSGVRFSGEWDRPGHSSGCSGFETDHRILLARGKRSAAQQRDA